MKNPLGYQTTEYDCGPATMLNAVSFLFNREEIQPDVVKHIVLYSLDGYNQKGESGKNGTSKMAMQFLCGWLGQFGKAKGFPVQCEPLLPEEVFLGPGSKILAGLRQNGATVVRLSYGCWHYVLFTGADEDGVYLFDPYFRKRPFRDKRIEIITDAPAKWNRRVPFSFLNSEGRGPYALGPIGTREAVLMFNGNTRKAAPANPIEYYI